MGPRIKKLYLVFQTYPKKESKISEVLAHNEMHARQRALAQFPNLESWQLKIEPLISKEK